MDQATLRGWGRWRAARDRQCQLRSSPAQPTNERVVTVEPELIHVFVPVEAPSSGIPSPLVKQQASWGRYPRVVCAPPSIGWDAPTLISASRCGLAPSLRCQAHARRRGGTARSASVLLHRPTALGSGGRGVCARAGGRGRLPLVRPGGRRRRPPPAWSLRRRRPRAQRAPCPCPCPGRGAC